MQDLSPAVIPAPQTAERLDGSFTATPEMRVVSVPAFTSIAADLADTLGIVMAESGVPGGVIRLIGGEKALGAEGYRLEVMPTNCTIAAATPAGAFYGVQTLLQLVADGPVLPALRIEDRPRFPWRGLLLDCCRHFLSKEFVLRYIDLLAYHKMNRLHWHLTEDQGWRLAIRKYPRLTEIGSWRQHDDGSRYGGFYTQDDVREVVAYAASRHVTVVPEIEMPGHAVAALAAYPELSCTGGPFEVQTEWGIHADVFCAGNDQTFAFLEDVLTEVMELFPGEYIHIGGDECPKERWRSCPKCLARVRTEGLRDEHELQGYFIKRVERFLTANGRKLIGWDEILQGGLPPSATVQSWRNFKGAISAATSGHDAIISPTSHAYFDHGVAQIDLRRVYSFEPVPDTLTAQESKHILGGECNMWTEYAPQETIDAKVFPRLLAMAECLWTETQRKNYDEFQKRARNHCNRLEEMGLICGPARAGSNQW